MPVTTARIVNRTRNSVLAEQAEIARTVLARLRGLLGRKSLPVGGGMILLVSKSIHTWFMAFPIDVLYLDRQGRVLRLIEHMPAGRFGPFVWRAAAVVELPAGAIARSGTQVGDTLDWI